MIPAGYHYVPTRVIMYQHCRGYDPELLRGPDGFAVWCPVCEHMVKSPGYEAISDWNDHVVARLSGGKG